MRGDDDLVASLKAAAAGYLLNDKDPGRLALPLRGVLDDEAARPAATGRAEATVSCA
jgi:hypothetical protein